MLTDISSVLHWHLHDTLGECERDPGLFASHIKVRDATGNERGDRERAWHSDRADSNTHVLSASQQERERVSHVFRVKMRHRLPEENAQGQRDWWGLTQSEAERWFCALTLFQTPSKITLNMSDVFASWKTRFFCLFSSKRVYADKL